MNSFSDEDLLDVYKIIGSNVKRFREEKGLSQLDLTHLMGYKSVSLVSAAELCTNGKHFNIAHLYKIARIFNVDITDLFQGIKTKTL